MVSKGLTFNPLCLEVCEYREVHVLLEVAKRIYAETVQQIVFLSGSFFVFACPLVQSRVYAAMKRVDDVIDLKVSLSSLGGVEIYPHVAVSPGHINRLYIIYLFMLWFSVVMLLFLSFCFRVHFVLADAICVSNAVLYINKNEQKNKQTDSYLLVVDCPSYHSQGIGFHLCNIRTV